MIDLQTVNERKNIEKTKSKSSTKADEKQENKIVKGSNLCNDDLDLLFCLSGGFYLIGCTFRPGPARPGPI